MADTTYKIASPEIVFDDFDGEAVILDLSTGRYFSFSGKATALWTALTAGGSFSQVANVGIAPEELTPFIEKAVTFGLLKPANAAGKDLSPEIIKGLKTASGPPEIEVFDDIADLITSDPIHEVDKEAGWPVKPADL